MLILKSTHEAAITEREATISALHTKLNYANALINSQAERIEELMDANYKAELRLKPFMGPKVRGEHGRFVSTKTVVTADGIHWRATQ